MNGWLNFAGIKHRVALTAVLEHYQWKCLRRHGDRVQGRCPIHRGRREDTFHADLRQQGFHCFSCQAHGSVLDLVAAMERCSLRQAALLLQDWFGAGPAAPVLEQSPDANDKLIREKEPPAVPLRFTLRPVDGGPMYLRQRGIEADTAAHFGVGYYAGPGLLHGRVVIPIQDERSQLLAYAGRCTDSCDGAAKYRFPYGFRKSRVVFNLNRASALRRDAVLVVEGFFDALKVHQSGVPAVVALMGCSLSEHQATMLEERFRHVVLMLDGDDAGRHASHLVAERLSRQCTVDIVNLAKGQQPDQLSTSEIHKALMTAVRQPEFNWTNQSAETR